MPVSRPHCQRSATGDSAIVARFVGRLKLKPAAAKEELQKASTGALGSILKQHASSVLVTECAFCSGHAACPCCVSCLACEGS